MNKTQKVILMRRFKEHQKLNLMVFEKELEHVGDSMDAIEEKMKLDFGIHGLKNELKVWKEHEKELLKGGIVEEEIVEEEIITKLCPYCMFSYLEKINRNGKEECTFCGMGFFSIIKDRIFLTKKFMDEHKKIKKEKVLNQLETKEALNNKLKEKKED